MMDHVMANALYDIYGGLLTDRQQEILKLSIQEDLSLAEIAEELHISRPAVQESLRRAMDLLEHYEDKVQFKKIQDEVLAAAICDPVLYTKVLEIFDHADN